MQPDETPEVIEGDAEEMSVEEDLQPPGRSSIERGIIAPPKEPPASLAVAPQVQAQELAQRMNVIREAAAQAMEQGIDYGKVPGGGKDTLFKPGAEKLGVLFRLDIQPDNEKRWEDAGHLTVVSKATVYDAPTGIRLGSGEGICSTREKKYAMRRADYKCPKCGQETVLLSRKDPEFFCWKKKGGCGVTFSDKDEQILSQEIGDKPNPDLPDLWNTIDKMASKRARVDAVLAVTGASAIFTQDLAEEDETSIDATDPQFRIANEVEKESLRTDLKWLLPPDDGREVWGKIKQAFGGELYGPAVDAVCVVIRAHKANVDAERTEAQEALNAEKAASDG